MKSIVLNSLNSQSLIAVILLSLSLGTSLRAEEAASDSTLFEIGGRNLRIPPPAGFVRCDGINENWDTGFTSILPPSNRLLATYGSPEDQDLIRKSSPPDYSRNFNIQTVRSVESREIGERTFAGLRNEVKKGIDDMRTKLDTELKKLTDQSNKKMSADYGVYNALEISDTVILGYFEESDTSIGFTMVMKVGLGKGDNREVTHGVVACLMTPVNGRLVNLYSSATYKGKEDQLLVEKTVKEWRDSIQAVNPKVEGPTVGFDSERLGFMVGIGAGVGLFIGLFRLISKKMKGPKSDKMHS
jgi:hypothetical protein